MRKRFGSLLPLGPALVIAAATVFGGGSRAEAETGDFDAAGTIERGRKLLQERRYERAAEELELVASEPRAGAKMRIEALEVLGLLHLSHDASDRGRGAFKRLVALDPGHRLSDPAASEGARDIFVEVRDRWAADVEATVDVQVAPKPGPTDGVRFEISASGSVEAVSRVVLFVRRGGEAAFGRVEPECDGHRCVAVVEGASEEEGLSYYAEAQAPSGYVVGRAGSIEEPRLFGGTVGLDTPEDGEPPPPIEGGLPPSDDDGASSFVWYRSWWIWTIVGAVVVGGAAAAVALTWPEEQLDDGSLGPILLP